MSIESALQTVDDVVAELRAELKVANAGRHQAETDRAQLWVSFTMRDAQFAEASRLLEEAAEVIGQTTTERDEVVERLALVSALAEDYCNEISTIPMGTAATRLRLDLLVALNPDRETYPLTLAGDDGSGEDEDTWNPVGTINDGRWTVSTHDWSHALKVTDNRTGELLTPDNRFTFGDDGDEDVVQDWLERKTYELTPIDEPACAVAR